MILQAFLTTHTQFLMEFTQKNKWKGVKNGWKTSLFSWVPRSLLGVCHCTWSVYSGLYSIGLDNPSCCNNSSYTIFCWINVPAWINARPTFDYDWLYLRNSLTDLNHIFPTFQVVRCPHCDIHWTQTRLKVQFLPPRPAGLFGEIRYLSSWTYP